MIRITITHIRDHPDGSTTETIADEYLGSIEGLAARLIACRAALETTPADDDEPVSPALARRLAELPASLSTVDSMDSMDRLDAETPKLKPPTVITSANHAPVIVSSEPRPVTEWTGSKLYSTARRDRAMLAFIQSFGSDQHYPRRMLEWSSVQCEYAFAAWESERGRSVA